MKSHLLQAAAWAGLFAAVSVPAHAQDRHADDERADQDIIVTAQRREQSLSDIPMAISVAGAEDIVQNNIVDASGLVGLAPGLTGKAQGLATPVFAIRGISTNSIGIGGESSIGVFWDETYLGRLESANLPLFDVERIEVLRGPQSTLFGRNASAGALSITSRRPGNKFAFDASASYASFDTLELTAGVDLPIAGENLMARAAGLYRRSDGAEYNMLLGRPFAGGETVALRTVFAARPGDARITWITNFVRDDGTGFPSETLDPQLSAASGVPIDPFDGRHSMDSPTFERRRTLTSALIAEIPISNDVTLKSISSYLRTKFDRQFDVDGSALPLLSSRFRNYRNESVGQELRLTATSDHFDWFLGGAFFDESVRQTVELSYSEEALIGSTIIPDDLFFPGQPAFNLCSEPLTSAVFGIGCNAAAQESITGHARNRSHAVFGELNYRFDARGSITIGARWSHDRKRFVYSTPPTIGVATLVNGGNLFLPATAEPASFGSSWSSLQPRLVVDYKLGATSLLFASVSRGFKAGGFDPTPAAGNVDFDSENVWAYEFGARHTSADRRLRLAASLYFLDYSDYQIQILRNGTTSTINAPKVLSHGAEIEADWWPTDALQLEGSFALNSAAFRRLVSDTGDLSGNRLLYSPAFTAYAAANWRLLDHANGSLTLRGSIRHESRQYFSKENLAAESDPGFTLLDAALVAQFDHPSISLRLFAQNLLDTHYLIYAVDQGFGVVANRGRPRTVGIELRLSY